MKKILLIIFMIFLFSCEKENIIEVKHTNTGYTSEVLATIKLQDKDNVINGISYLEGKLNLVEYDKKTNMNIEYSIDLETKEITQTQTKPKEIKYDDSKIMIHETNNYKIYSIKEDYGMIYKYYYEKDYESNLIFEYDYYDETKYRVEWFILDDNVYFFIPKDEYLSLNEMNGYNLKEIEKIPYNDNGYELVEYVNDSNGYRLVYKNNTQLKVIDGSDIQYYDLYIDDYELNYYSLAKENKFIYSYNGNIKINLDGQIYDLGFNPLYVIKEEYILNNTWKEGQKEKQTIYIDRNTNEEYLFSEYIDFYEYSFYYEDKYYLVKNNDENQTYSIMKLDNKSATLIDLPFPSTFSYVMSWENSVLFYEINEDEIIFYIVKF